MRKGFWIAILAMAPAALAQPLNGVWDARIDFNGVEIPFKIEFAGEGAHFRGWFFNGDERETSTSGTFEHGSLDLRFDDYATELTGTLKGGVLEGQFVSAQKKVYPFQAKPFVATAPSKVAAPSIDGLWEVEGVNSAKGESTWRLIVRQRGAEVSAAILRVDGDTGALTGTYRDAYSSPLAPPGNPACTPRTSPSRSIKNVVGQAVQFSACLGDGKVSVK